MVSQVDNSKILVSFFATSKTGQGNYTYAGNQGESYANPHAVTSIGSTNLTYDQSGNLLTKGSSLTNTWNHNNQLASTVAGSTTTNYTYDADGQRLKVSTGSTNTYYANKFYNVTGTTPTKHIFANGIEIGVITNKNSSAVIHYTATDHLTGSNLTTNTSDAKEELLDYFPFGTIRVDDKSGSYSDQRKFASMETESYGLNYDNARYYDPAIGRFISEDPAFLAVGDPQKIKSMTGKGLDAYLSDPQGFNSYAYARNNPLIYMDPTGLTTEINSETGKVLNVIRDGNTSITTIPYNNGQRICAPSHIVGYSFEEDTFQVGSVVHVGVDKTGQLYKSVKSIYEPNLVTAYKSMLGGEYDIKNKWGYRSGDGVMFEGKYGTLEDLGNILAGINARVGGVGYNDFQRTAGGLHQDGMRGALWSHLVGLEYGSTPEYGETKRQYQASSMGYYKSYNNYLNSKK